jgi:hypothetical protein
MKTETGVKRIICSLWLATKKERILFGFSPFWCTGAIQIRTSDQGSMGRAWEGIGYSLPTYLSEADKTPSPPKRRTGI